MKYLFDDIASMLKDGARLCVMDYDIVDADVSDFLDIFCSEVETKELEFYGVEKAWEVHTARGLEECVSDASKAGFRTLREDLLGDYFLWIGEK